METVEVSARRPEVKAVGTETGMAGKAKAGRRNRVGRKEGLRNRDESWRNSLGAGLN